MAGNTFGTVFRFTSFGESHGAAIGGIIDGCPAGLEIDMNFIQVELDRRKPGQSNITTQRKESDRVQFLSGIFENKTLGSPIGFIIPNEDQQSKDYHHLKSTFRPSHADFSYQEKYGLRDYRGGGRSSARETATRVVAGAIAKLLLRQFGIGIRAYVAQVGSIKVETPYHQLDLTTTDNNPVRCPDSRLAEFMVKKIEAVRKSGDSLGGAIVGLATGVPPGLGEPVFDKLHADLGKAMLSINAVKGIEFGSGFSAMEMKGSEHNDAFEKKDGKIKTNTNHSGGIQGGISNGEDIHFRLAFKPVATIMQKQSTVNEQGEQVTLEGKGRHDPCVVPRAVPIVEAMTALVLADFWLRNKTAKL
jgi:chorismate synthase